MPLMSSQETELPITGEAQEPDSATTSDNGVSGETEKICNSAQETAANSESTPQEASTADNDSKNNSQQETEKAKIAYESAKNAGFLQFNVKNFPFIHINISGLGGFYVNLVDLLSSLSKTTRRKLSKLLSNSKEFSPEAVLSLKADPSNAATHPVQENVTAETNKNPGEKTGSLTGEISNVSDSHHEKRLALMTNALGLPSGISISKLKFVLKAVTPDMKSNLISQLSKYKNNPKVK
jgi:hypothetical protein